MTIGVLDLGTTNTVGGYSSSNEATLVALGDKSVHTRTALYEPHAGGLGEIIYGDAAIRAFLEDRGKARDKVGRLITSPKSCLPTQEDVRTNFGGGITSLQEIIGLYISWVKKRIESVCGETIDSFVISHPVKFSDDPERHQKALERLSASIRLAGIKDISFETEPVAAARKYASELQTEEIFLIADAGGGTTDFTIVKAGPGGEFEVLGSAGIVVGGNNFDGIVSDLLSPQLGKGGHYRQGPKLLDIHNIWYFLIKEWHNINPFLSRQDAELLRRVFAGINGENERLAFSRVMKILNLGMINEWHEVCEELKVLTSTGRRKRSGEVVHDAEEIIDWLPANRGEEDLGGLLVRVSLDGIEAGSAEQIDRILFALQECKSAALVESIDRVVFTGGTCLIPFIRQKILAEVGNPGYLDVAPFSAVAEGLLTKAQLLS